MTRTPTATPTPDPDEQSASTTVTPTGTPTPTPQVTGTPTATPRPGEPTVTPDVEDTSAGGQPVEPLPQVETGLVLDISQNIRQTEASSDDGFSALRAAGFGLGGILCGLGGFMVWRARRNGI